MQSCWIVSFLHVHLPKLPPSITNQHPFICDPSRKATAASCLKKNTEEEMPNAAVSLAATKESSGIFIGTEGHFSQKN